MRRGLTAAVALVALTAVGAYAYPGTGPASDASPPADALATTPVVKGDLVASVHQPGRLGYLGTYNIVGHRSGTVTAVAPVGAVVDRGQPVYAVDQRPVPLLLGLLPFYRPLGVGSTGADVRQLEENLVALGHGRDVSVDDRYTRTTAEAVRRWQRAYGGSGTGRLEAGEAVVAPGAIRVGAVVPLVGEPVAPGAAVVSGTGTTPGVRVQLDLADRAYAVANQPVQVRLPAGRTVQGQVSTVGSTAQPAHGGSVTGTAEQSGGQSGTPCEGTDCPQSVPVDIALTAPEADLGGVHEGAVSVAFTAETRRGVLSVPVEALTVAPDGAFTVVLVDSAGRRTIPVTTGLFAAGRVEVTGDGISEGVQVEVPAT